MSDENGRSPGRWVMTSERNPHRYGKYCVLVGRSKGATTPDIYLWNGGYWVTPGGSPSKAVQQWYDEEADSDD